MSFSFGVWTPWPESSKSASWSPAGLSTYQVRAQAVGLTFLRCSGPLAEIFRNLAANKEFVECRGVVDRHSDGTPHVHVLLQKTHTTISVDRLCCYFVGQVCRCHVRILSTRVHQQRWHVYLEKEGVPEQFGHYKVPVGKKGDLELLELAQRRRCLSPCTSLCLLVVLCTTCPI